MQLQGLMFMLFILLIIPAMALFTNHFIFFAIMAVILIISSIKNIYLHFFDVDSEEDDDPDDEAEEEFEDLLNLNMKKFGIGIYVVKDLFLILFFVYCSFYLKSILLKIDATLLILIQIYHIKSILNRNNHEKKEANPLDRNQTLVSGILSLLLIVFTSCNLIFGQNF